MLTAMFGLLVIGILGDLFFGFSLFIDGGYANQANFGMSLILTAISCFGGAVLDWLEKFDAGRLAAAEPTDAAYEPTKPGMR